LRGSGWSETESFFSRSPGDTTGLPTQETNVIHFPSAQRVDVGEVSLDVHEAGEGLPVVLCHGFPELAYSWRHQIAALANAGYHVLAPDQRGYGGSDRPADIQAYDLIHLTNDLVGLLDARGIEKAVFAGHDWGGFVAWAMPILHPDRCLGLIGVNTPYVSFPTTDTLRLVFTDPEKLYILWFQEEGVEAVLESNCRAIFEKMMRRGKKPELADLAQLEDANPFRRIPELTIETDPILSDDDIQVYVDGFTRSGFFGPVSWYRNIDRNARLVPGIGVQELELPTLMVTAEWDAAISPTMADGMSALCKDYERVDILECGHWTQQEKPEELSSAMIDWLGRRFS
jgi:pimeloyl-ACP methyl ester carboxylesterase